MALASYVAGASFSPVATTPTDVVTIAGSATKNVYVTRVKITGSVGTASAIVEVVLIKRSTADTAGTFVADTAVPLDSNSGAATATAIGHYTANPTLGTAVGNVKFEKTLFSVTTAINEPVEWLFDFPSGQAIVLHGTAEELAINLNNTTLTTPALDYEIQWLEQ